ncbi:RNA polymerase sigma factor, sigma-70 family [Singulisphaera sp. GP187]|uniref:sigma-70 family RNA polymerase sigma factor n=1 Tax=Singulisphaera sp. GP187 TaxID=1882752 RepID=UPI00092A1B9B|nr:sigma-70 family RNA polymerase sigma factor [Singulisphaera sp. GP187]SIO60892.1 RNA polymerase sigma factor, sigma-70 family [Singulisphaera sp. GP187]
MAIDSASVAVYLRGLGTLFGSGSVAGMTDRELLERFVTGSGDCADTAFAALVLRHGPMVLGVCRRALADPHDVEDAFQATFLVLVRKAGSIRVDDSLGGWLHAVSRKVAVRARSLALKRPFPAGGVSESWEHRTTPSDELDSILDEEIDRLPRRYGEAVRLCYLEGMALKEAAARLGCQVGTVGSRLSRAKDLLRLRLIRRGFTHSALALPVYLASGRARAAVPEALIESASEWAAKGATRAVPTTVAALASYGIRSIIMSKGLLTAGAVLVGLGCLGTGAAVFGRGDEPKPKTTPASKDDSQPKVEMPTVADQYKKIIAEFEGEQKKLSEAVAAAKTEFEGWKLYGTMSPDDAAYSKRMVDLALTAPNDPVSRDALVWVLNKTYCSDCGPYGDQFARAVRVLVNQHADDPEAVRVALSLDNILSRNRDALMDGLYVGAVCREAKGLARLAMAQYLEKKALLAKGARTSRERHPIEFETYDDTGKLVKKSIPPSNEEEGYRVALRLLDPDAVRREAERLYEEVIDEYGDIPYVTTHRRKLEALQKEPVPMGNNKPLTVGEIKELDALLARKRTLGEVALGHLDEMHNLAEGKPAPEIDGKDIDGRSLKLSDYRGKVVVLVFWGSWCGPCMREVPHERELVEKYKGRPFALLGVNCNENIEAAKKAMKTEQMTWPQWHDGEDKGGPIVERFHVRLYPTVFVIDAKGIIRHKNAIGESLDRAVDSLLNEI